MIVDNEFGYLFTDEAVEKLLHKFENLNYEKILLDMYKEKFKIEGHKEIDIEHSIKSKKGTVIRPTYNCFNSLTYEGAQLNFKSEVATLYLNLNDYQKELIRQKNKFL